MEVAILQVHNMVLCVASAVMLAGCVVEVFRRADAQRGWLWMLCESTATSPSGPLFFWSYMYYLSKYYEMLDTVLALSCGSIPPSFNLHVFHHALVPLMAWLWLETLQSLQFVGLIANTFVHVIMYYYYYLRSGGIVPWWKNAVTRVQIIQFVTSFVCLCLCIVLHLTATGAIAPPLPDVTPPAGGCAGLPALSFNAVFNLILLFSFVGVLGRNSKSRTAGAAKKAA